MPWGSFRRTYSKSSAQCKDSPYEIIGLQKVLKDLNQCFENVCTCSVPCIDPNGAESCTCKILRLLYICTGAAEQRSMASAACGPSVICACYAVI